MGPGNSIATWGGCRTWPAHFKCQRTSCRSGRYEAGFARGRSRLEVCRPSGPMGGSNAGCGGSWQLAFEQMSKTSIVVRKVISFEILIPYIHSTWIGDQAL